MDTLWTLIVVVGLFGLTIFVHELGHFLVARACGMVVETFAIGFGPALWKRKVNGITYKIGCLPFGGYVALPQMDPTGEAGKQKEKDDGEPHKPVPPAAPWKRIVVAIAGATGNMILAFLIAYVIFWVGKPSAPHERRCVVGYVEPDSPSAKAGLHAGDRILKANGAEVKNWEDVLTRLSLSSNTEAEIEAVAADGTEPRALKIQTATSILRLRMLDGADMESLCQVGRTLPGSPAEAAGLRMWDMILEVNGRKVYSRAHLSSLVGEYADREVPLKIRRPREGTKTYDMVEVTIRPKYNETEKRVMIGIGYIQEAVEFDEVVHPRPLAQIRQHTTSIFRFLRALTTPKESKAAASAVGGPVSIVIVYWQMAKASLVMALWFTVFLNVNLAVLNLLPIPVLDGGHVVFTTWEWITGRPVGPKVLGWIHQVFAILLITLFLFLTYRDSILWLGVRRAQKAADTPPPAQTNAPPAAPAPPAGK